MSETSQSQERRRSKDDDPETNTREQTPEASIHGETERDAFREETKELRLVRGRKRAALTRLFQRAEALMSDGATSTQLQDIQADIDNAFAALINTDDCLKTYLKTEEEKADAAQYVAAVRAEKRRINEKIEAYVRAKTTPAEDETRAVTLRRPESQASHDSGRRLMSQVSSHTAVSRASAEAQISAKLKTLRVQQLQRKHVQEHETRQQEDKLRQQEEELKNRRELQKARDEAEEARLEARLRAEMMDDLNADRKNDFLDEDLGEHETARDIPPRSEYTRRPRFQSDLRLTDPIRTVLPQPQRGQNRGMAEGRTSWIDDLEPAAAPMAANRTSAFTKSIPRLKLPMYSGKPAEWPRWIGLFRALVHDQPSLSDAERMAHLQAAVTGQAQQAISGMLFDGNLYQQALKTLQDRFGQSEDVIRVHIESIFSADAPLEDDAASLETFQSIVHSAVTILQSQGYEADLASTENLRRTVAKLPPYLRREWAKFVLDLKPRNPSLFDMDTWLQRQVKVALLCPDATTVQDKTKGKKEQSREQAARRATHATATSAPTAPRSPCPKCSGDHRLFHCREFKNMSVDERVDLIFAKGICLWCLQKGHLARDCSYSKLCGVEGCQRRHNQLIHGGSKRHTPPANPAAVANQPAEGDQPVGGEEVRVVAASTRLEKSTGTLLQIVPVRIHGNGVVHDTCALLDPGSETSFCTEAVLNRLNLTGEKRKLCLQTVEGIGRRQTSTKVQLQLSSLASDEQDKITVPEAWSVPALNISVPHVTKKQRDKWRHIQDLEIPQCSEGQVELLLGANVIEAVIQREVRTGQPGQPIAVRTAFGWTLTGAVTKLAPENSRQVMFIQGGSEHDVELNDILRDWWTTEAFGTKYNKTVAQSMEDRHAQETLEKTTAKLPDDRYETGLLWKKNNVRLPDSKAMATRRLLSTEKRLMRDPDKAATYKKVINGYIENGYACKISSEEEKDHNPRTWYLPHHGVTNPRKPGKLRVVFDAAAKCGGTSLNDQLLTGPDLLKNLPGVLLRFREKEVAMTADIQEMYHQVRVIQPDRPSLRFLWRDLDETKKPETLEMQVTIFGAKSSPASANFVLQKTIIDHGEELGLLKETMDSLKTNFYMDDFLLSEKDATQAKKMRKDMTELLSKGGFRLTKWSSNSREVLESIPREELAHPELDLEETHLPAEGLLGVLWDVKQDQLKLRVCEDSVPATKRGVLQKTASIFDPLGIAAPFVLMAKILMQKLWTLQLDWDDELEGAERDQWERWLEDLPELKNLCIDRCMNTNTDASIARELHVFCDASEKAFGAVAYLRVTLPDKTHHCNFVTSKTRVAPLKRLSIVRLELQAAVLAVRLVDALRKEIPSQVQRVTYWSDSKVVLQYIANESRRFHTFVGNRVAEIHDLCDKRQWRHCPSQWNPADMCSRGVAAAELVNNSTWTSGPKFLQADEEQWPDQPLKKDLSQEDTEVKVESFAVTVVDPGGSLPNPNKCSSWTKYKRTAAWMLRFMYNSRRSQSRTHQRRTGPLSAAEMEEAEQVIIKQVQTDAYGAELKAGRDGRHLEKKKSAIADLSPFIDGHGLLRVGGRLLNAPLDDNSRHPVILPAGSGVTRMIIDEEHQKLMHAGVDHTLNDVRMKFWIPKGRAQVKRVLHNCSFCRNRRAMPQAPKMADLPADRFDVSHPFSTVGVDYFGPLTIRRFRKTEKRYGLLVTCLTTRAVHLELSHSMDTDSFLMALRRFIARRGRPKKIYSDNGTNLKGGERELREALSDWNQQKITDELSQRHIEWHFNPPAASHMGGVWERLVGSTKKALAVVLGGKVTTDEILATVFCEVESMINGRPLTHVTDDVRDLTSLTPNHFLLGRGSPGLPPGAFSEHDLHTRKRWRYTQAVADHLWNRWRKEYLHTLLHRRKWQTDNRDLAVGDLVLLAESNAPRGLWPLARVTQVFPGPDGRVRTVTLATAAGGTYTRPATKVALLEGADASNK